MRLSSLTMLALTLALAGCPQPYLPQQPVQPVSASFQPPPLTTLPAPPKASEALTSLDIAGADSLMISNLVLNGTGGYRIAAGEATALYRLNADDSIARVQPPSVSDYEILFNPTLTAPVGNDYVFIDSGFGPLPAPGSGKRYYPFIGCILARKSDGKVGLVEEQPFMVSLGATNPAKSPTDRFFYVSRSTLYQVMLPTGNALTFSKTALTQSAYEEVRPHFQVDPAGNVLAVVGSKNSQDSSLRLYKAAGGFRNVAANSSSYNGRSFWLGADDQFYYADEWSAAIWYNQDRPTSALFHQITLQPDGSLLTRDATISNVPSILGKYDPNPKLRFFLDVTSPLRVDTQDRTVFLKDQQAVVVEGLEFTFRDLSSFSKSLGAQSSRQYAYFFGRKDNGTYAIAKFDPRTFAESLVVDDPNYQPLTFSVSSDDDLVVSALRLSDNTYVVARPDSSGHLTVISSSIPQISSLLSLK